ncbi:MAG: GntR family transcriptional regulator [Burkholderiaceae bacterium]|nr:GntR family transcriptional regulator [Burkholderiaceae bacterium]
MDVKVSSVSRETIRTRAEASLREAIVSGRLGGGERLVERELCEALQVGRGSLREALRGLVAEGLIEVVPHRGPVVARITVEQAREIYAVRGVLEGLAARTLAQHREPHAIERMTSALERMRDIHRGVADAANLIPVKTEFYSALFEGAGNATLTEIMNRLLARISVLRRTSFSRPDRLSKSIVEIARIVEAIRSGEPDEAERTSRHHVEQACLAALPLLPSSPPIDRRNA